MSQPPTSPASSARSGGLLRFLTCGSVDDGKSTLIGRLLHDTRSVPPDQIETMVRDSIRRGRSADDPDYSLLLDGLLAEREQGITIDVAYRFFSTARRHFIVADTPGHEQYTRNMATGASTAQVAVMLCDARRGLRVQTRRHATIASLLGIRHVVLAVNKIDLVGYDQERFRELENEFRTFADRLNFRDVMAIPLSARAGDNITGPSENTPWYTGPALIEYLETVEIEPEETTHPFRMPVQIVLRPQGGGRCFGGTIASGALRPGDQITNITGGASSRVARIATMSGDLTEARTGDAVAVFLEDEIDASRGDVLSAADSIPPSADRLEADLVWMQEAPLLPGAAFLVKIGTLTLGGRVAAIRAKIDVDTLEEEPGERLLQNEVAKIELVLDRPVPFESYDVTRHLGGFILIDRITNATAGAGMVRAAAATEGAVWHRHTVDTAARSSLKGHSAAVLWFTGLSGAGKSTVANLVEQKLLTQGCHTYLLDGDNLRHGLNKDLSFSQSDRRENIRRIAEVSRLFHDSGLIVLVSAISPYAADRAAARALVPEGAFVEVFVDAPIDECARRDPKGLYARAKAGEITGFTGIDAPYETPENPEVHLEAFGKDPELLAEQVVSHLRDSGLLR
ncbi:adenylyl-sulfate kinase [Granulibacter bethesdensis]|uniref:adenylyl-sulfate kinase n=1 Tax=Granulibacter bethesdensis TaxID=364410 RepID=UPI00090997D0|nr:adenylyl-sulfate kinase [Granulibacter bethesdensis]APH60503.1 Sulfate adenylyltransferase subunit 1 [Granulibacter bethesdensis]